jgi:hypothetical protein
MQRSLIDKWLILRIEKRKQGPGGCLCVKAVLAPRACKQKEKKWKILRKAARRFARVRLQHSMWREGTMSTLVLMLLIGQAASNAASCGFGEETGEQPGHG